jgi:hypothetical protein
MGMIARGTTAVLTEINERDRLCGHVERMGGLVEGQLTVVDACERKSD